MSKVVFAHGSYCLNCEPVLKPDGRFCAMVIITRRMSRVVVISRRFPPPECFGSSEDAVVHARQWAIGWIDAHVRPGAPDD